MITESTYNIVESNEWANLINEVGDGGDTSNTEGYVNAMKTRKPSRSMKEWRTSHDPVTQEIRRIPPDGSLPDGFV